MHPARFFRADMAINTKNKIAFHPNFTADGEIRILRKTKRWYANATFYVTPIFVSNIPIFVYIRIQLFIIFTFVRVGDVDKQEKNVASLQKNAQKRTRKFKASAGTNDEYSRCKYFLVKMFRINLKMAAHLLPATATKLNNCLSYHLLNLFI